MNEDRIEMSQRERDRLRMLSLVLEGNRTQVEAGRLLRLSSRQVRRLQRRLAKEGDRGIVHRLRGRPSNHRHPASLRRKAVSIFRREMPDFGRCWHRRSYGIAGWRSRSARFGTGWGPRGCCSPDGGGTSIATGVSVGHALGNWCRPTAAITTGWRGAARGWFWWRSLTTPPAR